MKNCFENVLDGNDCEEGGKMEWWWIKDEGDFESGVELMEIHRNGSEELLAFSSRWTFAPNSMRAGLHWRGTLREGPSPKCQSNRTSPMHFNISSKAISLRQFPLCNSIQWEHSMDWWENAIRSLHTNTVIHRQHPARCLETDSNVPFVYPAKGTRTFSLNVVHIVFDYYNNYYGNYRNVVSIAIVLALVVVVAIARHKIKKGRLDAIGLFVSLKSIDLALHSPIHRQRSLPFNGKYWNWNSLLVNGVCLARWIVCVGAICVQQTKVRRMRRGNGIGFLFWVSDLWQALRKCCVFRCESQNRRYFYWQLASGRGSYRWLFQLITDCSSPVSSIPTTFTARSPFNPWNWIKKPPFGAGGTTEEKSNKRKTFHFERKKLANVDWFYERLDENWGGFIVLLSTEISVVNGRQLLSQGQCLLSLGGRGR